MSRRLPAGACLARAAVLLLGAVAVLSAPIRLRAAEPQPPLPEALQRASRLLEQVRIERDVVYGKAGDRKLMLDVVLPLQPSAKRLPAVVFIHGGGWRAGNKLGGLPNVARLAATGNYVGVSVGYRLSGEAIWPAQIHDCKAAIRFLRAEAERFGIDPEKIGVWGSSAGGHLVSLLGTSGDVAELEGENGSPGQSSRVTCVVDFCGPSDFTGILERRPRDEAPSAVTALLGGSLKEKEEEAKQASPVTWVSKDDPPFLIVHGTEDNIVPLEQAETLHQALKKVGADVTFVKIVGGGHGIGGPEIARRVEAFFEKHLRGRDVEVSSEPIR